MGCFGYICNGCKTQIVGDCFTGGELAILKHIRHGEVLGEVEGHYNEYGTVIEVADDDSEFRGDSDHINSHMEICKSEWGLEDSIGFVERARIYNGKPYDWQGFVATKYLEQLGTDTSGTIPKEIYDEWNSLPKLEGVIPRSGVEAWHVRCYNNATEAERLRHTISEGDPNQSWGNIRPQFK